MTESLVMEGLRRCGKSWTERMSEKAAQAVGVYDHDWCVLSPVECCSFYTSVESMVS